MALDFRAMLSVPGRLGSASFEVFRRRALFISCAVLAGFLYIYIVSNPTLFHESRPWENAVKCGEFSEAEKSQLVESTKRVLNTLDQMQVSYWLFYGSLWEVRRYDCQFMSGRSVDIAIIGNGIHTEKLDEFLAQFEAAGLTVSGNSARWFRQGWVKFLTGVHENMSVNLYLFYERGGVLQRSGVETWLFYYNFKKYHSFPSYFVEKPLPKIRFQNVDIPVPRGGMEVLRYVYPTNWNQIVTAYNCSG